MSLSVNKMKPSIDILSLTIALFAVFSPLGTLNLLAPECSHSKNPQVMGPATWEQTVKHICYGRKERSQH